MVPPIIAITLGDPEGIGPEIIQKSLASTSSGYTRVVLGSDEYFSGHGLATLTSLEDARPGTDYYYHIPLEGPTTDPSFLYVSTGVNWALQKKVAALVTAPISKEKWLKAGIPYKGHTDYLAESAGVTEHCMFFWSEDLKVALFTVHIPLKEVFSFIKRDPLARFIRFVASQLSRLFRQRFNILVTGINPHAGENGYLGREEIEEITPAINLLKEEMDIAGPFPPDVVFLKARNMENSVVISLYHDQGLIPFKLLNLQSGVNMTLGLPYIRTSPDHGTAYDIAGQGIADPSSMIQAIKLAERLVGG